MAQPNDPIWQAGMHALQEAANAPIRSNTAIRVLEGLNNLQPIQTTSGMPETGMEGLADVNALAGQAPSGIGTDVRMDVKLGDIYADRAQLRQRGDIATGVQENARTKNAIDLFEAQNKYGEQWDPVIDPGTGRVVAQKNRRTGETKSAGISEEDFGNPTIVIDEKNQPKVVQFSKQGRMRPVEGFTLPSETEQVQVGDKILLIDKITKKPVAEFAKNISPDTAANVTARIQAAQIGAEGQVHAAQVGFEKRGEPYELKIDGVPTLVTQDGYGRIFRADTGEAVNQRGQEGVTLPGRPGAGGAPAAPSAGTSAPSADFRVPPPVQAGRDANRLLILQSEMATELKQPPSPERDRNIAALQREIDNTRGGTAMVTPRSGAPAPAPTTGAPIASGPTPPAGATPKLSAKPSEAEKKDLSTIEQQNVIVDGAMKGVAKYPGVFGFERGMWGQLPQIGGTAESVRGRLDTPEATTARSYVFNVVSKVINERAGAAQSAQELARLRSFLPAEIDNADQIMAKLQGFKQYLADLKKGAGGANPPRRKQASDGKWYVKRDDQWYQE